MSENTNEASFASILVKSFPEAKSLMERSPLYLLIAESILLHGQSIDAVVVNSVLMDARRQNDKRSASLEFAVPDELVKNLRGEPRFEDLLLFVRVPREVLDEIKKEQEKSKSPIVLAS